MQKILFNDKFGLTDAVLSGRKTVTRRIIKYSQLFKREPGGMWTDDEKSEWKNRFIHDIYFENEEDKQKAFQWLIEHSKYKVGEVIAIAQKYKDTGLPPDMVQTTYRPDLGGWIDLPLSKHNGWSNKMFVLAGLMPHHIRITDIRIEKLQDISDEDCLREGIEIVEPYGTLFYTVINVADKVHMTPREAYAALIDKISGKGTWESNPYVMVVDFELVD